MEDAATRNDGQKLLNEESQENGADGSQVEVVDQEQRLQLERLAVAHQLATAKDDGVVNDNEDARLLNRRHGRLAGHEAEDLRGVSDDGLEGLAEDWP